MRIIHRWFGIALTLLILVFAVSGIILNHRQTFSGLDVSRNILPAEYRYQNWNNASVQGHLRINNDSVLIYGNTGIWLTDSAFRTFTSFNNGFGSGIDKSKVSSLVITKQGKLISGTQFGLYYFDNERNTWNKIIIPGKEQRITDLLIKNDSLLVLTRSQLFVSTDLTHFNEIKLLPAKDYDNKVSLFRSLWTIHSGSIYALPGILIVDAVAIIFGFLCISGIIFWIRKSRIKSLKNRPEKLKRNRKIMQFYLRWHNKIGWITIVFLVITTLTGMFLRPPLLITIINGRVPKIPYTVLADPNAWYDKLRKIAYDPATDQYILASSEGIYACDPHFENSPVIFPYQPPVSVMGITVMQKLNADQWLIGSFEGLFAWNPGSGLVMDYISKKPYHSLASKGRPTGENLVSGFISDKAFGEVFFDYNLGASNITSGGSFVAMPPEIQNSRISLWNVALEFHTARIFHALIGEFYILIVPLTGLSTLLILISGFIVWYKHHRK